MAISYRHDEAVVAHTALFNRSNYRCPLKLHLDNPHGEFRISSYAEDAIVVNDERYTGSVIVTPTNPPESWDLNEIARLDIQAMEPLLAGKPEVVLIGTGPRQIFPDVAVLAYLSKREIGIEIMDSRAACRTFNIVAGEGRRVVAGLLPLAAVSG